MKFADQRGERGAPDPLAHLPPEIRRAIEITPAAGTRERIVDITTTGRRTGRSHRIEIFFYRANGATYLCSGAGGGATGWYANLQADPIGGLGRQQADANRLRLSRPACGEAAPHCRRP
ncbi:nitroreductase/quinone reductase family protein [Micromonospora sp. LH3U1]|uniref:nitroreductase/quinone reductase family protein n=1 Tax=Micromonospora sp. LH3U1 TaxID=3018339 RepID=UPI00234AD7F2|nr:nitroreductase/quinone reductase family protein [Micromonospora sp. LH3U1]WCN83212.1 nitroreductase/quinone reductase family protein [Micromonospora sp. LH3U1]